MSKAKTPAVTADTNTAAPDAEGLNPKPKRSKSVCCSIANTASATASPNWLLTLPSKPRKGSVDTGAGRFAAGGRCRVTVMLIRADLQTAVSVEPITLAEAKLHLRVDHSGEDTFISAAIVSARQKAEAICARRFGTQTWELTFNSFDDVGLIQCGKVASVAVSVRNTDGTWSEVPTGQYELVKSVPPPCVSSMPLSDPHTLSIRKS